MNRINSKRMKWLQYSILQFVYFQIQFKELFKYKNLWSFNEESHQKAILLERKPIQSAIGCQYIFFILLFILSLNTIFFIVLHLIYYFIFLKQQIPSPKFYNERNYLFIPDILQNMDSSDDQKNKMDEQVNAFNSLIPPKKKNIQYHGKIEISKQSKLIKTECEDKMKDILQKRIKQTVDNIFRTITQNWRPGISMVIALNFKRNQQKDLDIFIDNIQKFNNYTPEQANKLKLITVQLLSKSREDVRDIALDIQIMEDQLRKLFSKDKQVYIGNDNKQVSIENQLVVYVPRKITTLSQSNIHVFQNSVIQGSYVVFLPTFQNLKIVDGQGILQENQKYFYQAYNSKELFIEYFYRCLVSQTIMAYLPKQILSLISMYDYYPISYHQGCKIFMYACQIFNAKYEEKTKQKKKYVQMRNLIRIFNRSWKQFWDEESVTKYNYEKLLHVILDQNAVYRVSQKKIEHFRLLWNSPDFNLNQQKQIYHQIQKTFKSKLQAEPNLKHLAKILDDYDENQKKVDNIKMKKKFGRNRELGLGFDKKSFKSDKQYFQDKITNLFRQATKQVRQQASKVDWKEMNVFKLIAPQLLKETVEGIMQQRDFRDVFNTIRSFATLPMGKLIQNFKNISMGRLIYILRCLQLKGLIEINKNTLKPSLITNYYEKSTYYMSQQ